MPDPDPAHWLRVSLQRNGRAIGFALPHGSRFEGDDPRRLVPEPLSDHAPTQIYDGQYEFGRGWGESGFPQFVVLFELRPYSEDTTEEIAQFRKIARDPDETPDLRAPGVPEPAQEVSRTEVVRMGGRDYVVFYGPHGPSSYAMPFSKTHALFVQAVFWSGVAHDEIWYEARRKILQDIVRSVTITNP
jgi:hypothetical protein